MYGLSRLNVSWMSKIKFNLSLGCNVSLVCSKEVHFDESILSTNQTSSDWFGIGNSTVFISYFLAIVCLPNFQLTRTFRLKMNVVTVECELIGGRVDFRSWTTCLIVISHTISWKKQRKKCPWSKVPTGQEKKNQIRTVTRGVEFHPREKQKFFYFTRTKIRSKNKPELWWNVTMQMGLIIERVGHTFNANSHTVEWKVLKCASLKDSQKPFDCECASIYFCWHFAIC